MKKRSILILSLLVSISLLLAGCTEKSNKVVIYTSCDQVFAEPILKEFQNKTGISVQAVYDVEATKSTGLANRLLTEKDRPQADVFWSSELAQTLSLKSKGVLDSYKVKAASDLPVEYVDSENMWTGFGGRARVILVNKNLLSKENYPKSINDFLSDKWQASKVGIAHPIFGTSNTHAAALYAYLGEDKGKKFYKQIKDRGVMVVDGNSVVKDMVASGQLIFGLTDTDDAMEAVKKGSPVEVVFPDQDNMGTLVVPNTVALVKGGPNSENGKKLVEYLASAEVEKKLIENGFCEVPIHENNKNISTTATKVKTMKVSFEDIFKNVERVKTELNEIFVR